MSDHVDIPVGVRLSSDIEFRSDYGRRPFKARVRWSPTAWRSSAPTTRMLDCSAARVAGASQRECCGMPPLGTKSSRSSATNTFAATICGTRG